MRNFITISILFLFGHLSFSQTKLVIGQSDSVQYAPSLYNEELDSIVNVGYKGQPLFCETFEVFFDSLKTKLAFKSYTKNDTCYTINYWRNGKVKMVNNYTGPSEQPVWTNWYYEELYCNNGQLIRKTYLNSTEKVTIVNYYCNGNKKNEFSIKGPFADGKHTWWYPNGQIQSESYFKDNNKVGTWKYWDINGNLTKKEIYIEGILQK